MDTTKLYGTGHIKSVSYRIQLISNQEHVKKNKKIKKLWKDNKIHDITEELSSNGMLSY
jgi:hypothetical protein